MCHAIGRPEDLQVQEVPDLQPGPGQVLLQMKAAGVNFPDALMIQGKYQFKPPLPFAPGCELAGVVLALGEGATGVQVGQRVLASCVCGAFAEQVLVDARHILPMPDDLGFDVAAAFMLAYGTSYHALKGRAQLKAGETLLVLGASGGVGLAAVQIGKALGARVIAAASTADKLALCQRQGAFAVINYAQEDLRGRLKALTDGRGPDVIYDPVGGSYSEPALRSIAWGGRYLVVGFANGEIPSLPLNLPLLKGASLVGVFWGEFVRRQPADFLRDVAEMLALLREGRITPHISRRYGLEQGAQALRALLNREVTGKVIITANGEAGVTSSPAAAGLTTAALAAAPSRPALVEEVSTTDSALPTTAAELAQWVGRDLGVSSWITLDQARIDDFARCTQDTQWIHVDVQRAARESPFGGTIAHAFLSLSMIPLTMYEVLGTGLRVKAVLNYGLDRTRFMSPVRSGQRVRNRIRVVALQDKGPGRWLLTTENTFEIEDQDKSALVATALGYLIE